jgi:hypothetical protein
MEIRITKVNNGYIVIVPCTERFAETNKCTNVFESFKAAAEFIEKEFNPLIEVEE